MNAAIFGGGIAGLTSAIALGKYGHHSSIYERIWHNQEAGMGFIMLRDAIESLETLGAPPRGAPLRRYCCRDAQGALLHQQSMPEGALGVLRRELIASLINALPANGFLSVDCALDNMEIDQSGNVVAAQMDTGGMVQADLYVGAEGMRSRARQALFPGWPATLAQVQEITGLAKAPDIVRWAGNDFNKFHDPNGGLALGVVPVDSDHAVWYLQFDSKQFPSPGREREVLHDFVTRLVGRWADPVPELLAITECSQVYLWRPLDTDLIPRFHQDNLVLVGDAAHPLLPFTSQGVSSAVADALALADSIGSGEDLVQAMNSYSRTRHDVCVPYIHQGRKIKDRFLSPLSQQTLSLPIAETRLKHGKAAVKGSA